MKKYILATLALVFIIIIAGAITVVHNRLESEQQKHPSQGQPTKSACSSSTSINDYGIGLGEVLQDGEHVGLSDGTVALDLSGNPNFIENKCKGVQEFSRCLQSSTSCSSARDDLTTEIEKVPDDAEGLIYRQNIYIHDSPDDIYYFTVIVGVSLSNSDKDRSHYLLQGVYTAQEEFNRTHSDFKLRILIANFGDTSDSAAFEIKQQILPAIDSITKDSRIVGIINIPLIAQLGRSSIQQIVARNIPIIFPSGSTGSSNEQFPTIFHIAPPAWQEGTAGAYFARNVLNDKKAVVFVDPNDQDFYSHNLACSFLKRFGNDENSPNPCDSQLATICQQVKACFYFDSGKPDIPQEIVTAALNRTPDLLYFAGDVSHAKALLKQLRNNQQFQQLQSQLRIMGGDALYQPGAYDARDYPDLAFTAYAFPDEWGTVNTMKQDQLPVLQAPFFHEYALDFQGWPPDKIYGFIRPDSTAILSYDATNLLAESIERASQKGKKTNILPNDVLQDVQNISFQGFSGIIRFDNQGNPIQKATVFLVVNNGQNEGKVVSDGEEDKGKTQMQAMYGCFRAPSDYCFS